MPKLVILSGIPGSKRPVYMSKWKTSYEILSRDEIRDSLFGKDRIITNYVEEEVTREFNFKLNKAYLCGLNIIINNTNCKEEYIDKIIAECPVEYDVELKFFDTSLYMAYWRIYLTYLRGGRYVPFRIIKKMKNGFDLINKDKYKQYASYESNI